MNQEKLIKLTTNKYESAIGKTPPLAHPCNCPNKTCPYGRGHSFCFPCYAEIMKSIRHHKAAESPNNAV